MTSMKEVPVLVVGPAAFPDNIPKHNSKAHTTLNLAELLKGEGGQRPARGVSASSGEQSCPRFRPGNYDANGCHFLQCLYAVCSKQLLSIGFNPRSVIVQAHVYSKLLSILFDDKHDVGEIEE